MQQLIRARAEARRQLRRDYREEDLRSEGLRIFTTLAPRDLLDAVGRRALFVDHEHDGDLDVAVAGADGLTVWVNTNDGFAPSVQTATEEIDIDDMGQFLVLPDDALRFQAGEGRVAQACRRFEYGIEDRHVIGPRTADDFQDFSRRRFAL